jgi:hypothetical protein
VTLNEEILSAEIDPKRREIMDRAEIEVKAANVNMFHILNNIDDNTNMLRTEKKK